MNNKEVMVVIDEITARIGATAETFMPKLVDYGIKSSAIVMIVSIVAVVVGFFALRYSCKHMLDTDDLRFVPVLLVGTVLFVVGFILLCVSIAELVEWTMWPDIKAIKYVMGFMP